MVGKDEHGKGRVLRMTKTKNKVSQLLESWDILPKLESDGYVHFYGTKKGNTYMRKLSDEFKLYMGSLVREGHTNEDLADVFENIKVELVK